ncbi:acyl carrier protein [Paenibacillus sp. sptzw28]|uniref:acyl carrier protein n=1 Tax=Paenibacillus sp. sptzw28 TaxID=715179 RepID=UPI001C6E7C6C|nr:phosphopantetheine-binding protein [Paenibacillus sp. sptzw28]QYR20252.1 acyl carrier protein [Paenibacillus sp. sptzw28]
MERLLTIINEMLTESGKDTVTELEDSLRLREDLGMDSLKLAELTVRVEEEFDVDIFDDGIVSTVGEVLSKIEGR